MESRTQGSRPRPRTQKNPKLRTNFPRAEPFEAKDRNTRGLGHNAQVFSLPPQKGLRAKKSQIFHEISGVLQIKKDLRLKNRKFFAKFKAKKNSQSPFLTNQKIVLSSTEDRAFSRTCRLRGHGQGQGLQNVSSRPRTSKCVLEAKDVLLDSTSDFKSYPIV